MTRTPNALGPRSTRVRAAAAILVALAVALVPQTPALAQTEIARIENASLAFQRDGNIWVSEADGTGARMLYAPEDGLIVPYPVVWLPTGNLLVIDSSSTCTDTVEVGADGKPTVFPRPEADGCPQDVTISRDGRYVAYASFYPSFQCAEVRSPTCSALSYRALDSRVQDYVRAGGGEPLWYVRFSPDGTTLYGVRREFGATSTRPGVLIAIDLLTNKSRTILPDVEAIDVAANGDIVVQRNRTIMIRRNDGSLSAIGPGSDPAFSEDGDGVYVVRDGEIWLVPVSGGAGRRITEGVAPTPRRGYRIPTVGQVSASVAFLREGDIWFADKNGERRITKSRDVTSFAWLPDAAALVALKGDTVVRVNASSGATEPFDLGRPRVSALAAGPLGRIAFVAPNDAGRAQLWLRRAEGPPAPKGSQPLSTSASPTARYAVSFSQDGSKILVSITDGTRSRLEAFATDTLEATSIADVPAEGRVALASDGALYWSGTVVAGQARRRMLHMGDQRIAQSLDNTFDPAISPDGDHVLFTRTPAGARDPSLASAWIAERNGAAARPLVEEAAGVSWMPGSVVVAAEGSSRVWPIIAVAVLLLVLGAVAIFAQRRRREAGEFAEGAPTAEAEAYGDDAPALDLDDALAQYLTPSPGAAPPDGDASFESPDPAEVTAPEPDAHPAPDSLAEAADDGPSSLPEPASPADVVAWPEDHVEPVAASLEEEPAAEPDAPAAEDEGTPELETVADAEPEPAAGSEPSSGEERPAAHEDRHMTTAEEITALLEALTAEAASSGVGWDEASDAPREPDPPTDPPAVEPARKKERRLFGRKRKRDKDQEQADKLLALMAPAPPSSADSPQQAAGSLAVSGSPSTAVEDGVEVCAECGAAKDPSDAWCSRCGIRRDECGCVWYFGSRRITCWPHFKELQDQGLSG